MENKIENKIQWKNSTLHMLENKTHWLMIIIAYIECRTSSKIPHCKRCVIVQNTKKSFMHVSEKS